MAKATPAVREKLKKVHAAPSDPASAVESAPPVAGGKSKQPKRRMGNATYVLNLLKATQKARMWQIDQDKLVEDAYDRLPPMDPQILAKNGEGWRTNYDSGDTENAINEKSDALVNLIMMPKPFIGFNTKPAKVVPGTHDKHQILANGHHALLTTSDFWIPESHKMIHNMVATGLGIIHWPEPRSWKFESQPRCNLIYPPNAPLNPDKWEWMGLVKEISIVDLIAKLSNAEAAAKMGWKIEAIQQVIDGLEFGCFTGGRAGIDPTGDPEAFINALSENDLHFASYNKNFVKGYTFYVREFDGRITEHILVDKQLAQGGTEIGFLYSSNHDYKRMTEFIRLFPLTLGQGFLEKVRGLGHRLLPYHAVLNDLNCRSIDTTILAGSLMLKGTKEDGIQDMQQLELGGVVTLIPQDLTLDQRSFGNPAQGLIALSQHIRGQRESNNRVFGGVDRTGTNPEKTATQSKLEYGEAVRGRGFETDRFYLHYTGFHQTLWQRLLYYRSNEAVPSEGSEEVKEYWTEMKDAGVTQEDLDAIKSVATNNIFGDGDPNAVFLALKELEPYMASLPISSQRAMLRALFLARSRSAAFAEEMVPTAKAGDRDKSEQDWRTSQEESAFESSDIPVPLRDDDITTIHASNHTVYAEGVVQDFNNKVLPAVECLKRLVRCRDHALQHLQLLLKSKKDEALSADLNLRWKDIMNMMRRMEQMVAAEQAAERERQMEEMRNPTMTVADREKMLTEQAKRAEIAQTEALRRQEISETEATKRDIMTKGALTKVQLAAIDGARELPDSTAEAA